MTDVTTSPADFAPDHSRRDLHVILVGLMLAMVLAALDQSIVNTALPAVASELGGMAHLSWVVTAFMLASTTATPIFGKLGDMFGRRNLLLGCITLFIAASALCGLAQSLEELIAFRLLQGIGGGGLMTLTQTTISDVVGPRERLRYQGLFTGAFAFSSVAGPLLGGGLTTALSWRWVFYVNIPVGAIALTLLVIGLKLSPVEKRSHQIDWLGAILLTLAAGALLLLFSLAGSVFPRISTTSALLAGGGLIALALFIWQEKRAAEPMVDLSLFKNGPFTIGTLTTGGMTFAMMCAMVFLPLYLQLVLGMTAAQSGLVMLPQITMMLVSSVLGGRLSAKIGKPKLFLVGGIILEAAGLGLLAALAHEEAGVVPVLGALAVLGTGMGSAMPNATVIVQNAVPRATLGVATAAMSFLRSLGGALGVAVSGGVMTSLLAAKLAGLGGVDASAIATGGMQVIHTLPEAAQAQVAEAFRQAIAGSFMIGCGVMCLALLLSLRLKGTELPPPEAKAA
ncbi:EmrB/QacA subfamily drug resistance transporter [Rhodobacter aestuarii]|uniref:Drug resistance transporter, EmrB/QacA subfamily n=1 Tax=Rhodobacter aestuarii TaxID=453582 RepID=A0A1N7M0I2_9RHOB|nr:MDR family MFS transporter [Rhodobacter aestuarii]PTV94760.1 EmrB/QacA subfamily drug resistance transporter [Rhodobacter aestuarii]SIS79584.1 drug resistance transporter, EmrB/QacA subfamily [Rhodobacter aestuarii]